MDRLLKLLEENARYTNEQLAVMTGMSVEDVEKRISEYEKKGIIKGYKLVLNRDKLEENEHVSALIELKVTPRKSTGFDEIARDIMGFDEVESIYLMSGGYDFSIIVNSRSFKDVALFVSQRLAPLDSVLSTSTHFVLTRYKDGGIIMCDEKVDERRSNLL